MLGISVRTYLNKCLGLSLIYAARLTEALCQQQIATNLTGMHNSSDLQPLFRLKCLVIILEA